MGMVDTESREAVVDPLHRKREGKGKGSGAVVGREGQGGGGT